MTMKTEHGITLDPNTLSIYYMESVIDNDEVIDEYPVQVMQCKSRNAYKTFVKYAVGNTHKFHNDVTFIESTL